MAAGNSLDDSPAGGVRRWPHPLALGYFAVFAGLVVLAAGLAFLGDPHAGEPVARLDLPVAQAPRHKTAIAANQAQAAAKTLSATRAEAAPGAAPAAIAQPVYAGRALIADPALIENTAQGPLPRIADNGMTPMHAYAGMVASDGRPRIAIVVGGLGISAKATAAALAGLPAAVTLAFAPYAPDVGQWVAQARKEGHEVLLEVPMEPYDFPDSDPGPHTLRAGVGEDANTERLVWALTRFTGYTGVTNLLGGRFLADPDSLSPIMSYLARRGLLFFDASSSAHSVAPDVATRVGIPFAQATSVIDYIQTATEIDRRLSELETAARAHGSASGAAFLYPVTIDRVGQWARGLGGRGFVLVPASAIVSASK